MKKVQLCGRYVNSWNMNQNKIPLHHEKLSYYRMITVSVKNLNMFDKHVFSFEPGYITICCVVRQACRVYG